jgi:CheY-like chemotaxis protein
VLVAVTGWGQSEDIRNAQLAGFDHHLVKPPDVDELWKVLAARFDLAAGEPRRGSEARQAGGAAD